MHGGNIYCEVGCGNARAATKNLNTWTWVEGVILGPAGDGAEKSTCTEQTKCDVVRNLASLGWQYMMLTHPNNINVSCCSLKPPLSIITHHHPQPYAAEHHISGCAYHVCVNKTNDLPQMMF